MSNTDWKMSVSVLPISFLMIQPMVVPLLLWVPFSNDPVSITQGHGLSVTQGHGLLHRSMVY